MNTLLAVAAVCVRKMRLEVSTTLRFCFKNSLFHSFSHIFVGAYSGIRELTSERKRGVWKSAGW